MRFDFDLRKSQKLRANPKRRIGFEEAREIFSHPFYLDQRAEVPSQHRAIGWVSGRLYSLIFEIREDQEGEYYHFVTLWKATKEEQQLYEAHS
ncbi:MAG TPA: BrnT family toxin [Candidatus Angelobacter sp.]